MSAFVGFAASGEPSFRSLLCPGDPFFEDDEPPTRPGEILATTARQLILGRDHALLTVLSGINAGQVFELNHDETTLGRTRDADVHVEGEGVSRRHARIVRSNGRHMLVNLEGSQGVFVNGTRVDRVELQSGDRIGLGPLLVLRFALVSADEKALAFHLYEGSTRDALTGLYNRRYFDERLEAELAYAKRHKTHLGLLLFDLDHFKRINDVHGHVAGDMVLRIVTAQLQRVIRKEDVLARYGGEEFVVIARGIEHRNAGLFGERLRRAIEMLRIPWQGGPLQPTVSIGVASLEQCPPNPSAEALLELADQRLYEAKRNGRNLVRM
jgi:two-component system cell cycle response regulator